MESAFAVFCFLVGLGVEVEDVVGVVVVFLVDVILGVSRYVEGSRRHSVASTKRGWGGGGCRYVGQLTDRFLEGGVQPRPQLWNMM